MGYPGEDAEVPLTPPLPPGERGRVRARSETWMTN